MWAAMFRGLNPILAWSHTRHSCFLSKMQKVDVSSVVFTAEWLYSTGSSNCANSGDIGEVDNKTRAANHPEFYLFNMIWKSTHSHFQSSLQKWLNCHQAVFLFSFSLAKQCFKDKPPLPIPLTTFSNLPFRLGQPAHHFPIMEKKTFLATAH